MGLTHEGTQLAPEVLAYIEGYLQSSLHPIRPNQEFVNKLRHRLVEPAHTTLEANSGAMSLVVVGVGLLCGILVLVFGKRSILFLLPALLLIVLPNLRKVEEQEQDIVLE
jgi:hypothetical protein